MDTGDHVLNLEAKQAAYNKTHPNYYIYRGIIMGEPLTGRTTLAKNFTKDESQQRYLPHTSPEIYIKYVKAPPTKPDSDE